MRHQNGHKKGEGRVKFDKGILPLFISFVAGFLLSFFICWNTIIYIITLFQKINGLI